VAREPDFVAGQSVPEHGRESRMAGVHAEARRVSWSPEAPLRDRLYANSLKGSLAKLSLKSSTVRAWNRSRSDIIPRH
jgi:hypothetical protein